jgi:hypothetical protein
MRFARNEPAASVDNGTHAACLEQGGRLVEALENNASQQVSDGRSTLDAVGVGEEACPAPRTVEVERARWQIDVYGTDRTRARTGQALSFGAAGSVWPLSRRRGYCGHASEAASRGLLTAALHCRSLWPRVATPRWSSRAVSER